MANDKLIDAAGELLGHLLASRGEQTGQRSGWLTDVAANAVNRAAADGDVEVPEGPEANHAVKDFLVAQGKQQLKRALISKLTGEPRPTTIGERLKAAVNRIEPAPPPTRPEQLEQLANEAVDAVAKIAKRQIRRVRTSREAREVDQNPTAPVVVMPPPVAVVLESEAAIKSEPVAITDQVNVDAPEGSRDALVVASRVLSRAERWLERHSQEPGAATSQLS